MTTLKQTGITLGRELARAWDSLCEGWHELLSRSSNALTRFTRHTSDESPQDQTMPALPRWSLLAGELEETDQDIVVRIELPGLDKADCRLTLQGQVLYLEGEKRFERETHDSTYHVMERAYGAFQRAIPLPCAVNIAQAQARFKQGVLTVRLPKQAKGKATSTTIAVT